MIWPVIFLLAVLIVVFYLLSYILKKKKKNYFLAQLKLAIDSSRLSYLRDNLVIDKKVIISFVSIEANSEIIIYNPYTAYNHYGGKKYQEQPKKKKIKVLEKMIKENLNYNHIFVLLQKPFKIKAYYNESEIKTLDFNEKIYNYKFVYYKQNKIALENTFDF